MGGGSSHEPAYAGKNTSYSPAFPTAIGTVRPGFGGRRDVELPAGTSSAYALCIHGETTNLQRSVGTRRHARICNVTLRDGGELVKRCSTLGYARRHAVVYGLMWRWGERMRHRRNNRLNTGLLNLGQPPTQSLRGDVFNSPVPWGSINYFPWLDPLRR